MTDTITIDRSEYERLRAAEEDLADLRAYDRTMANLASGADEAIPAPFAHRLLAGESPLRVYRELRGLSQTQLAQASAVNRVQLADIEAGRKVGSVETIRKLAEALGVTIDDLV